MTDQLHVPHSWQDSNNKRKEALEALRLAKEQEQSPFKKPVKFILKRKKS